MQVKAWPAGSTPAGHAHRSVSLLVEATQVVRDLRRRLPLHPQAQPLRIAGTATRLGATAALVPAATQLGWPTAVGALGLVHRHWHPPPLR